MAYGYNESVVAGPPPVQIRRVGGWKLLVGAMLAAAGVGFAGYVYVVPYMKLSRVLQERTAELGEERSTGEELSAERDRLKKELAERQSSDRDQAAAVSRKQQAVETFSNDMKTALAAFGGSISTEGRRAKISFPVASLFEQQSSTVISAQGDAALKVVGASLKRAGFRVRILARLIGAAPPRELGQWKSIGEFAMTRALRVALAMSLPPGGIAADRIAVAGETPPLVHKGKVPVPDHLEIEIEPE